MKKTPSGRRNSPPRPDRRPIHVRRWWGNGDIEATVRFTRPQWRRICAGEQVDASTWAWYEGKRERVGFRFNHPERGDLYIGGSYCTDYYHGTIAEAQITGAEFPPCDAAATKFTVRDGGTLEMAGITLPETRAEAYDLSPHSLRDAADLLAAAETCEPLRWYLDREFEEVKAGPKPGQTFPNPLAELYAKVAAKSASESDLDEWLSNQNEWGLYPILTGVQGWLREEPNWAQEDDHIPPSKNAQGAALEFFQDWREPMGSGRYKLAAPIVIAPSRHPRRSRRGHGCLDRGPRSFFRPHLTSILGRIPPQPHRTVHFNSARARQSNPPQLTSNGLTPSARASSPRVAMLACSRPITLSWNHATSAARLVRGTCHGLTS